MMNTNPVRGTRDFLPGEMLVRDAIQDIILRSYLNNGFSKIETPIIEEIERLDKSDGGENLNMIFRILKRGQKLDLSKDQIVEKDLADMGLRFDLTLPLCRYFANNRSHLRMPFKVIQIGKVYRAERPQKGRFREFYQCDIDIIGDESARAEIELIHTTAKTLLALGFDDFTVRINDRRILFDLIESAGFAKEDILPVCIIFDKLDKIGIEGVSEELRNKGYAEEAVTCFMEKIAAEHQETGEWLSEIIEGVETLATGRYDIAFDKSLVRGMGYYTGTIFEIVSPKFKGSIAGGGRYDKMIGNMLGEDIPAVGFSIGFERIAEILLNGEEIKFDVGFRKLALLYDKETPIVEVIKKADQFRSVDGYDVSTIVKSKKLGKQLSALEKEGFEAAYVFGDAEIKQLGGAEQE